MNRPFAGYALLIVLTGCGATPLTPAGRSVRVQKSDPPDACEEVAFIQVASSNFVSETEENARNKARNKAAERGANYFRIESLVTDGNGVRVSGTAFHCP